MFCKNCGATMGDFDTICPNCGASSAGNAQYSQANYGGSSSEPIKTTGLLVWSIIEILCVNVITGIIGLVFWITKLKPAADRGDVVEAYKAKKSIKTVLWIGIAISVLLVVLYLVFVMLIAVPNFSGIQENMQVRADKSTAAQIGKATRIWYVEAMSEPNSNANVDEVKDGLVRLDEIEGIDDYIIYMTPISYRPDNTMEDSAYYVTIINEDDIENEKIVVVIGPENLYGVSRKDKTYNKIFNKDLDGLNANDANYDGNGSGIAYIEP